MGSRAPLPTLLSQALVAFMIEFDNETEHRMQHRTTNHGSTSGSLSGPWLVSMVMWTNCLQFVEDGGVTVREIERLARTKTNWRGMQRWGYIRIAPDPNDSRPKPPSREWIVRATPAGRTAREVGRQIFGEIEKRWQERFGKDEIAHLRKSLWEVAGQFDVELPDCLPILGYGLFSRGSEDTEPAPAARTGEAGSHLPLPALLARVLLAFAIDFERESDISLAIGANLLRVLNEKGVRVRDLPRFTGVSKESLSMAMGILRKKRLAAIEASEPGSQTKVARLTAQGSEAQDAYRKLLAAIEKSWQARFGESAIGGLRESLERLAENGTQASPLFRGLEPYPDGWRASKPKPETLPHYPMVLHRGGFPDGS
ncbi:MAG TPA: MarR family winged helix-turn-helix transcriptional regulator [Candidatus Acidoferrales bacterium]|nr:MarR family winged helix-turn-helix transcriptional regulator [Candidatus Acidoferrales bacterium]